MAGTLDDMTSVMLRRYQQKHALRETGVFDAATKESMTTTRCGLPDLRNGIDFVTLCSWGRCNLTFAFDVGTNDVLADAEFQAVRNAFATWASVVNFTFTEVAPNANPDVLIGWRPANDPDHNMVGGVLAHADFRQAARSSLRDCPNPCTSTTPSTPGTSAPHPTPSTSRPSPCTRSATSWGWHTPTSPAPSCSRRCRRTPRSDS